MGERSNFLNGVVNVQSLLLFIGFSDERANAANDVARAILRLLREKCSGPLSPAGRWWSMRAGGIRVAVALDRIIAELAEVQPNIYRASFNCPTVLSGELAFAETDLGHQPRPGPLNSSSWAEGNPGAVIDFFYTGIQKSVRGAKAVLEKFYGQPAKFNYFFGCSDGGREGLEELQRFPTEFDGAIIGAPVVNNVEHNVFWHGWNYRVNIGADGNAILTSDKIPALHAAVLAACGALNGGVGDYINDPRA